MKTTELSAKTDASNEVVLCETDDTTCMVCFAEFLDPADLELHIQQVHPSGNLIHCQFCDKIVSDEDTYVLHIRDAHLLDFKSCLVCYRFFTNYSLLKKHETKHSPSMTEGPYPCSQCGQFFLTKLELHQHEFDNHYNSGEGVFLNKYLALLSSVINIKANTFIKSVLNVAEFAGKQFTYVCTVCKFRNTDLEAYVVHLRKKNCRTLTCDRCCSVFNKKAGLALHFTKQDCSSVIEELSEPVTLKPKQCATCFKQFNAKSLKRHFCIKNIKCSHCNSGFSNMYDLSEHQSNVHPLSVELTMCKFCRKECVGTVMLEKHIQRAHSQELHLYKYTCVYCDTPFKHPQRLFAHYFMKHKDIEPYLCKICDTKFRIRKGFTLHIKLKHKSEGFVEFDERLHVFFTDKKSEKPFQPVSKYGEKPPETNNKSNTYKSQDLQLANMESDVNFTEAEGNQTDANENKEKPNRPVRTIRKRKKANEVLELSDYDSDDEPLVVTKKKSKLKSQLRKRPLEWKNKHLKNPSKKQFTCDICKKYCYTFQNYQNHLSMHFRDESKKCIKCSLSFKAKTDLDRHMRDQHSSSQLTETLKNLLERRKKGEQQNELTATKKFLNTIKKVQTEKDNVVAILKPVSKELSVQKFIENFTPEEGVKNVQVTNSISLTKVANSVQREPVIKLNKFKPAPEINPSFIKLAMPVKFKKCNERHSVTVKKVATMPAQSTQFSLDDGNQFQDEDDYSIDNYPPGAKDTNIPEAEQEVTLGVTEEQSAPKRNPASHKIVIPKLPKELKSIRIAHLLPEAPYYKIVKVADIMKQHQEKQEVKKDEVKTNETVDVRLPDGTKLVHVNPLAHLLGDKAVDQIVKPSKYYKPSTKNFTNLLANALKKLENNPNKHKKKTVKDTLVQADASESSEVTKGSVSETVDTETVPGGKYDYETLIDATNTNDKGNVDYQTLIDVHRNTTVEEPVV